MRIFKRLKDERAYEGRYSIVREYVAQMRDKHKEMFVPLVHAPGKGQVDFGEAQRSSGHTQKVHLFVMDLPYSDACFVKAYARENTESFCDGHVSAFDFFGGVPFHLLYDIQKLRYQGS